MSTHETDQFLKLVQDLGRMILPQSTPLTCPDPGDQHLWDLLGAVPAALLITGDRRLLRSDDFPGRILAPRECVERFGF